MNRQYLVNFSAIREAEHYFSRKLIIKLTIPTEEKLLVGKEKATAFLSWLENR
ncbi:LytTR family transcriptional regulator DNA-binding domain-containing protein [Flavobacterium sp. P21]